MKPKDCNDGSLAEAVFEFARETHELHLELKRSNNNQAILNRLAEMENRIMSAISDWVTKVGPKLDSIQIGIDAIQALVEQLQNSPGAITPEDQVLLDQIETKVDALGTDANSIPTPPTPA